MNIKVQMGMVLNLDKCLACHVQHPVQERVDHGPRHGIHVVQ